MPVVAAAIVPHPPLLVPRLAGANSPELDDLRACALAAVGALATAGATMTVLIGPGPRTIRFPPGVRGSFAPWGVAVPLGTLGDAPSAAPRAPAGDAPLAGVGAPAGGPADAHEPLPLSLSVGHWLAAGAECPPIGWYQAVAGDATPEECVSLGASVASRAERVAILIMGDGTARRGPKAPGGPDPRAEAFDDGVASALADGDPGSLLALSPRLADELLAGGRPAWQVMAGAVGGSQVRGQLLYHAAPLGVGYFVANWWITGATPAGATTARPTQAARPVTSPAAGRTAEPGPAPRRGPVIAIVGPTAAGKSAVSLALAKTLGGEIVNADSMQLYRGMDIGTAKLRPAERAGVPHHLLDIWEVTEPASVAAYQRLARAAIDDILARGLIPLLVGGSGLYVRAVLEEFDFPGTDPELRSALEAELALNGPEPLHARLAEADPVAAERILPSNGRRIVRALEVIALTGERFTASLPAPVPRYDVYSIGIDVPTGVLDERIATRVDDMWAEGLVEEVRELEAGGLRSGRTASRALGYQQVLSFLAGECAQDTAREATVRATRRFARRQRSWFRRDSGIVWFDGGADDLAYQTGDAARAAISAMG